MFNLYPYTDFHEINLDWIIRKIKELGQAFNDFEAVNKITNAGAWDITKQYQSWTIVSDNNMGYISLKPVPVGVAITNTEYWGLVADYDILITDLSARISALENTNHSVLKGRRFVIITDSYGQVADNFITQMKLMCPELDEGNNFFPFAYPGCGFVSNGAAYSWYQNFITSGDVDTVTDPETITDVLVLGGSNDRGSGITIPDIMSAGSTLYTALKNKFLNAIIYCGYIGYSVNPNSGNYAPSVKQAYQDMLIYGYRPISDANSWLHYTGYISDNVHPTLAGSRRIAAGVLNTMLGGSPSDVFNNRPTLLTLTPETGITIGTETLQTWHFGNVSGIFATPSGHLTINGTFSANTSWITIGTLGDTFLYGADGTPSVYPTSFYGYIGGADRSLAAKVRIKNNKLEMCLYPEAGVTNPFKVTYGQLLIPPMFMPDVFM